MGKISNKIEITGTGLKLIAVITMLIDHIGAGIISRYISSGIPFPTKSIIDTWTLYHITRAIGRAAFPIYCLLLVEGFKHTKNLKRYMLRLLLVALVSEIPFDYLLHDTFFYWKHNNVLWALLLGLIVMYGFSLVEKLQIDLNYQLLLRVLVMFTGMLAANIACLDYKYAGICCISSMYFLHSSDKFKRLYAVALGVIILTYMSSKLELWAFFILLPLFFYNGNRGKDSKALRCFFYLFYPAHIILLGVIVRFVIS